MYAQTCAPNQALWAGEGLQGSLLPPASGVLSPSSDSGGGEWGQALVGGKHTVYKHRVAVARSCDSARAVTPIQVVYSAQHPVQEAGRRGLGPGFRSCFLQPPDLTWGPAGGGDSPVLLPLISGNLRPIVGSLNTVTTSLALLGRGDAAAVHASDPAPQAGRGA